MNNQKLNPSVTLLDYISLSNQKYSKDKNIKWISEAQYDECIQIYTARGFSNEEADKIMRDQCTIVVIPARYVKSHEG